MLNKHKITAITYSTLNKQKLTKTKSILTWFYGTYYLKALFIFIVVEKARSTVLYSTQADKGKIINNRGNDKIPNLLYKPAYDF